MYVISCIKDNKTVGFWDANDKLIRTRTMRFYNNKADALTDFDNASTDIAMKYEGVLICLSVILVNVSMNLCLNILIGI